MGWAEDMDKDQQEHPENWGMRLDEESNPVDWKEGEQARAAAGLPATIAARHVTVPDEPPPIPNDSVPVWDLVIKDMQERDQVGRERYGTPLQVGNGRNHLVDAYQESLDKVVYLRAAIEDERLHPRIDEEALSLELYRRGFLRQELHETGTAFTARCREIAAEMFAVMREEMARRG